jgi:Zn-dependent protease with chaperone function
MYHTLGAVINSRKYQRHEYSTPEIEDIKGKTEILTNVKVYQTNNPWVKSPFANVLSSEVYLPESWMNQFPESELTGIVGHEFGHILNRKKFILEYFAVILGVMGYSIFLSFFTISIIIQFSAVAFMMLMITHILWRNEYRADKDGNLLFGPEKLIAVFEQLMSLMEKDEGSETHPPLHKRIKRLMIFLEM